MKVEIQVVTVPDRQLSVAEIWLGGEMIAEVSQDSSYSLMVEFYAASDRYRFDYDDLIDGLVRAKAELNRESAFEKPRENRDSD